jgi:hypothetical protein
MEPFAYLAFMDALEVVRGVTVEPVTARADAVPFVEPGWL